VNPGGELTIDEKKTSVEIYARLFIVDGKLIAGTKDHPFQSNLKIVLTGKSSDQDDPSVPKEVIGHGAGSLPYSKVLLAGSGSVLSLHGKPKTSWIKLAETAAVGSSRLVLTEAPSGWKKGDKVIVPTTSMIKRDRTEEENEVVTLASDPSGKSISIEEALKFNHIASYADSRLNGEVGILSHNIKITGDNTDEEQKQCEEDMSKGFAEANLKRIREHCYGGHASTLQGAAVQISNVELTRMGQATRIARYPIHWHLAADQGEFGSYAIGNSLWQNYQRCITVHGTWNARVEDNVCYKTYGHSFYLEDAIEHGNSFVHNLAVAVRPGPMVCTDLQIGPSAFWITNPNNTFIDNLAVDIGTPNQGVGYWFISGGEIDKENSPAYMGTDYWTDTWQKKVGGLVFNPSRTVFGPSYNASAHGHPAGVRLQMHSPAPNWMLGQQQGRTPVKEFRGNGVRSSFRGVHLDGFVTASVPGELGDMKTDPEDIHPFVGTANGIKDGTCNYFPAGNYAIPSGEGLRVFVPTHFSYNEQGHAQDFTPAWSILDGLHISRCNDAWWSRASRVNITNAIFAHNWVGMTNHIPGQNFCPRTGDPSNPGLNNNVVNSLFIGHGDDDVNKQLCKVPGLSGSVGRESPAGIRQYDGAFWLENSHWVNMTTVNCPEQVKYKDGIIKTLPYSLVSGRQDDCNGKFPIRLYNSWPLGASPSDRQSKWSWALGQEQSQNLGQFTGTASCGRGPSGGVADMTGTLNPSKPSVPTAYFAESGKPANPGELAQFTEDQLKSMFHYKKIDATAGAKIESFAWAANTMENPDFAHVCGYCFYDEAGNCPKNGPTEEDSNEIII